MPHQQDIISQFQAHYARQEQQKQSNTKTKRKTKPQKEKRADRLRACSEIAASLDLSSPSTTTAQIPTTYRHHNSPNEYNLAEMQQSERLLETITFNRDQAEQQRLLEQVSAIQPQRQDTCVYCSLDF